MLFHVVDVMKIYQSFPNKLFTETKRSFFLFNLWNGEVSLQLVVHKKDNRGRCCLTFLTRVLIIQNKVEKEREEDGKMLKR